jgi:hypothetical protein
VRDKGIPLTFHVSLNLEEVGGIEGIYIYIYICICTCAYAYFVGLGENGTLTYAKNEYIVETLDGWLSI